MPAGAAYAEDMIDQLDLKSDEFKKADVTREEVLAAITAAGTDGVADFSGNGSTASISLASTCAA